MPERIKRGALALVALVLLAGWWLWQDRGAQDLTPVVLAKPMPMTAPTDLAPAEVQAQVAARSAAPQDPLDEAWCSLPDTKPAEFVEEQASAPLTLEQFQQREAARPRSPKEQQALRALEQLKRDRDAVLAARGDERSRAMRELLSANTDPAARARLVELARNTADPAVYAWAYAACLRVGECTGLSARQWAKLDPGNLQPWLVEAEQARLAGNGPMLTEALYQIGIASRSDLYTTLLERELRSLRETRQPGLRQWVETIDPTFDLLRTALPTMRPLTEGCKSAALADPLRLASCEAAAEALWQRGETMLETAIALRMAERLPAADAARWASRRDERDAWRQVQQDSASALIATMGAEEAPTVESECRMAAIMGEFMRQRAQFSERAFAEKELAGRDPTTLAARWRAANPSPPAAPAAPAAATPR